MKQSFNPCFIGNPSATLDTLKINSGLKLVSILVLLEILLQQYDIFFNEMLYIEFQSLFYWKSFCNPTSRTAGPSL